MKEKDRVYVQGRGYTDETSAPVKQSSEEMIQEKGEYDINDIFREVRIIRGWITFMGVLLIIGLVLSIFIRVM